MPRLALALAVLAAAVVPATAVASVLPGPNGPIVFTSGRDDGATVSRDVLGAGRDPGALRDAAERWAAELAS